MQSRGLLRVVLAFAALLGSLALVVHRQSQAYETLASLDAARSERAMLESERSRLLAAIRQLESRARIARVSASWWGMRVPSSDEEFVIMLHPRDAARDGRRSSWHVARASVLPFPRGRERR
ncbi:MAG: cell division protein FtsL [Gemmatimonadetes bacterium]|nr:cell division protein FtsL [Gemmatimonadota bacterium]